MTDRIRGTGSFATCFEPQKLMTKEVCCLSVAIAA